MTERAAEALERAEESDATAEEAWENIQQLADEVDWDVERMLDEGTSSEPVVEPFGHSD